MSTDDFDPTATDASDAADAGEFALPLDYFELRCLMLDQFVMALTDLKMDVPTAVATSIDALTGRVLVRLSSRLHSHDGERIG